MLLIEGVYIFFTVESPILHKLGFLFSKRFIYSKRCWIFFTSSMFPGSFSYEMDRPDVPLNKRARFICGSGSWSLFFPYLTRFKDLELEEMYIVSLARYSSWIQRSACQQENYHSAFFIFRSEQVPAPLWRYVLPEGMDMCPYTFREAVQCVLILHRQSNRKDLFVDVGRTEFQIFSHTQLFRQWQINKWFLKNGVLPFLLEPVFFCRSIFL